MGNFVNKLSNYQVIPRELIFDNTLSDRARFLYCYMASKPNDWEFYMTPMAKEIGYSVETLRKYLNELIENGWLVKGEQKNEGVFGAVIYTLNCSKTPNNINTDTGENEEKASDGTKNTDTEKIRLGEIPTQHNIDALQSRDDRKEEEERIDKSIPKKKADNDVDEFVDRMYALYPAKCPKRGTSLGKSQKDKGRIKSLLKTYSESDIEFVIRWEIEQKYNKAYMSNFSTFLNNFPDPTQIDGYNKLTNTSTNTLPKGWNQERYDMYIRNGYTITEDGRLFKDGKEYK